MAHPPQVGDAGQEAEEGGLASPAAPAADGGQPVEFGGGVPVWFLTAAGLDERGDGGLGPGGGPPAGGGAGGGRRPPGGGRAGGAGGGWGAGPAPPPDRWPGRRRRARPGPAAAPGRA